ncbi:MAG: lmo0937 family membrane protein [Myxococcales bacterium]|nr:lmo0937 family membrane protein [Myxococcales bacterium]
MFWTISIILSVLWALGVLSRAPMGPWVHLFLALAMVSLLAAVLGAAGRWRRSRG